MKRSEAVELIACLIDASTSQTNCVVLADRIMTKLEEAGMLPPTTQLKPLNTIDNAWEPEDE